MKRTISVISTTIAALAVLSVSGATTTLHLDTRTAPLVSDSIAVTYDASWIGGDAGATVVISDNGTEVRRMTGAGEFTYMPTGTGRHELTYVTLIGGMAQTEVYRAVVFKDWKYEVADGGATITDTALRSGAVSVPATVDGYPVTDIAASAFSGCGSITSVTIPDSVTSIGGNAFNGCSGLTSVTIGNGVTSIGGGAFIGCNNLAKLAIPDSVRSMDWSALNGNDGLRILTVGTGIDRVPRESLLECRNLTTVNLPNGCTYYTGTSNGKGPTFPAGCNIVRYYTYDLEVASEFGSPTPGVGHHRLHTYQNPIHCSVADGECMIADGMKRVCAGWIGTGSVTESGTGTDALVYLWSDSSITWLWQTNVWIDCSVGGDASAMTVGQWAAPGGDAATIRFVPSGALFTCLLSGDVDGVSVDEPTRTITVPADRPRSVMVTVVSGESASSSGDYPIELDESEGGVPWRPVADATAADGMSLRSGEVETGGVSSMETSVEGPGTLLFDWRISANRWDYLKVYVDGVERGGVTQETAWEPMSLDIQAGAHTVRWSYERGRLGAAGEDAAFLDNIDWSPLRTYTVRFNANGGEGSMAAQFITRGAAATLNANRFTRDGYAFIGWAERAAGPVAHGDAATVQDLAEVGGAVTLYAVWAARDGSAADYLDAPGLTFETDGGGVWSGDWEDFKVGGASLKCGALGPSENVGEWTNAMLRTTVSGEGALAFWWKVSCEPEDVDYGEWYDFATFKVDGAEVAKIAGESGWRKVECEIAGKGAHVLEWAFWRDDYDEDGADYDNALWVDGVDWAPAPVTLSLGTDGLVFTTGGDSEWVLDTTTGWTNGVSAKSGAVASGESSWIEATVTGGGTLSFRWKVMGGIYRNNPFAYAKVEVDGVNVAQTHLTDGWEGRTLEVAGAGTHTIRWTYLRTSARTADGDCAWLDGVAWEAAAAAETATTPEPVPYSWLDDEAATILAANGGDYEAAASATAQNGRTVWECYVADLDPEDEDSDLVAEIAFDENGKPVVSIAEGESANRVYTTQGAKSLGGEVQWDDLDDGDDWAAQGYHFFRIKVELP